MLTDPESLCQDVPFHCEEPWIVPGSLYHIKPWFQDNETDYLKCVANFGLGKGSEDVCEENGGAMEILEIARSVTKLIIN